MAHIVLVQVVGFLAASVTALAVYAQDAPPDLDTIPAWAWGAGGGGVVILIGLIVTLWKLLRVSSAATVDTKIKVVDTRVDGVVDAIETGFEGIREDLRQWREDHEARIRELEQAG